MSQSCTTGGTLSASFLFHVRVFVQPRVVRTAARRLLAAAEGNSGEESDGHTTDVEADTEEEEDCARVGGPSCPELDEKEAVAVAVAVGDATAEEVEARDQRAKRTEMLRRSLSSSPVKPKVRLLAAAPLLA